MTTWSVILAFVVCAIGAGNLFEPVVAAGIAGGGASTDEDISDEEMSSINQIIQKTDVMRVLQEQSEKNDARIQEAEFELERMLNGINDHFEEILAHIESTEESMQARLKVVEDAVHRRIDDAQAEHEGQRTAWRIPVAAVAVLVLAISVVAYKKYKDLMKTHLL